MLLLACSSFLFFWFTYAAGFFTVKLLPAVFGNHTSFGIFNCFLAGLISSYVYFNIISFLTPVNYLVLLPHLVLTLFLFVKQPSIFKDVFKKVSFYLDKQRIVFFIAFMAVFVFYWLSPPINADSGNYHYLSIKWYEEYRVVPGLANLHGRLAFNPASFIISAPYSFSSLIGQAIYPVNGVIILLFSLWWFKKTFLQQTNILKCIYFIGGCFLMRQLLVNISSPSSDPLSVIMVVYITISMFHAIKDGIIPSTKYNWLFILILFGITCKLSLFPLLLLIPVAMILLKPMRIGKTFLLLAIAVFIIWVPWLTRNFIMSGYLIYPAIQTGWFNPDWKCPKEILLLDYTFIKYGPRFFSENFYYLQALGNWNWMPIWLKSHLKFGKWLDLAAFLLATLSPFFWLAISLYKRVIPQKKYLLIWLTLYAASLWWLYNSPEYRFGSSFLVLTAILPFLSFTYQTNNRWTKAISIIINTAMLLVCCYYIYILPKQRYYRTEPIKDYLFIPLRDSRYFEKNNLTDFPKSSLANGIELFQADSMHACINCPLPCQSWKYGEIEMRGKSLQDGFRISKNEVLKFYPFLK